MDKNNYIVYHLHSDLSTGVTNIDSVTKFNEYVKKAKECNMSALAFSEHGNIYKWVKKKEAIEAAGMKYIHAEEFYITEKIDKNKLVRDNYHCILIARNEKGVAELNKLSSIAFNREDGHYYYVPRITLDEFEDISENIIICTACVASILSCGTNDAKKRFMKYLTDHKDTCFLEIQHHNTEKQVEYNRMLFNISKDTGLRLIAGTDTHALNDVHADGRKLLQKSKNIHFDSEDEWDLTWKDYDELVHAYKIQNAIPEYAYLEAIDNTNVMADMVEEFQLDRSYKYPRLWKDSEKLLIKKIKEGIKNRGVQNYPNREEYAERVRYELKAYRHNGAIDFLLLMEDIVSWCRKNDIQVGYGRGSVNGSIIAWLIGLTEMDSIKFKLNFERFLNTERVSLSDIDTDFPPSRIAEVKEYIFNRHGLHCCDIVTFNTIADKGAIRDVVRGLYKASDVRSKLSHEMQKEYDKWEKMIEGHDERDMDMSPPPRLKAAIDKANGNYIKVTNDVLSLFERSEEEARKKYPEVFKYVDIVKGAIVSVGSHPCGTVVCDTTLDDKFGLFTTSTDPYPVSQIYMKEIDSLNYVKLDLLKLDTIQVISDTCKMAGIPIVLPDTLDIFDEGVWKSIAEDTTGIFQWESDTGQDYMKKIMSDNTLNKLSKNGHDVDKMTLLSIANSAIRPAGASYREDLAKGIVRSTGSKPIDDFLANTFGYLVFQCQIIEFLHKYCGFTMGEADIVRRGFAKKTGTDQYIPIIKDGGYLNNNDHYIAGYISTMEEKYGIDRDKSEEDITAFLQVIEDASEYLFSLNHSSPYSYMGYACGYLRYHYPVEFLCCALNIAVGNEDKTRALTEYAKKVGIKIEPIKFRYSVGGYQGDSKTKTIYKGIGSIKYMSQQLADDLYLLRDNQYDTFLDLLKDIKETSCDSRQLDILIKLDFFSEFGPINKLLKQVEIFDSLYERKQIKLTDLSKYNIPLEVMKRCSKKQTEKLFKEFDWLEIVKEVCKITEYPKSNPVDILRYEQEHLGYITKTIPNLSNAYYYVLDIVGKYKNKTLTMYRICDGDIRKIRCRSGILNKTNLSINDIIKVLQTKDEYKWRKDDNGEWYQIDETEEFLSDFDVYKAS